MKRLLLSLFCVFCGENAFSQLVTASLTITNTPTNGYTLTVDGTIFLWTNTPTPPLQIQNSNSIPADTTNLFNVVALAGVQGVQQVYYITTTNEIAIVGLNLTASISTNWATLSLTTNSTTNGWFVTGPASAIPTASSATNIYSRMVSDIDAYSTNSFGPFDIALSNYVSLQNTQTITGPKIFFTNVFFGNGSLNVVGQGILQFTNNFTLKNPAGVAIITASVGSLGLSDPNANLRLSITASGVFLYNAAGISIFNYQDSSGLTLEDPSGFNGIVMPAATNISMPFQTLVGVSSVITESLGDTRYSLQSAGIQTNLVEYGGTLNGTNTLNGFIATSQFANSSLANGNNSAINISTNSYVILSGPTGVFTNCGIAGGLSGRIVTLENSTGQTMWIGNQNGNDPTAANRILTGLSSDLQMTNNPGILTLRYDGAVSRWKVISHN